MMDLNICIEKDGTRDPVNIIEDKLDRCLQLGFHTVALSVYIDISNFKAKNDITLPPPPDLKSLSYSTKLKVYTRLTVRVGHADLLYKLNKHPLTPAYNLIALEPRNSDICNYLVNSATIMDILTFNLSDRLDFNLFKMKFKTLEDRNVCIEINYGAAQMGSSLRRNIICNGQNITEKTIKNVILSNGIQDTFRLRGPMDAMSIGVLFMIPLKRCHDTVHKNALKAIESSRSRKNPVSSAITLVRSGDE